MNSPFSQDLSEPFEIIIADDASHDGAVSPFSRELEKSQCPARLIAREKNVAFKQNWSKALRLAESPIIEYVDDDDYYFPYKRYSARAQYTPVLLNIGEVAVHFLKQT